MKKLTFSNQLCLQSLSSIQGTILRQPFCVIQQWVLPNKKSTCNTSPEIQEARKKEPRKYYMYPAFPCQKKKNTGGRYGWGEQPEIKQNAKFTTQAAF